jgi:hypothetical protein
MLFYNNNNIKCFNEIGVHFYPKINNIIKWSHRKQYNDLTKNTFERVNNKKLQQLLFWKEKKNIYLHNRLFHYRCNIWRCFGVLCGKNIKKILAFIRNLTSACNFFCPTLEKINLPYISLFENLCETIHILLCPCSQFKKK